MLKIINIIRGAIFGIVVMSASANSAELEKRLFCVWDPIGNNGPFASMMKNIKVKALKWGVEFEIKAYTDENIAANDFKAKQCDAVAVTDILARQYNAFTGSIGAVGALPTLDDLKVLLQTLSQPKAGKLMVNGVYEVAGILPAGPIYTFINDRSLNSFSKFHGKKMAVFEVDPVQTTIARKIGASPVNSSIGRFAGQFNNGSVDIVFAPATAYMPMELYKGMELGGGVIRRPLLQATLQVIIHRDKFSNEFGQKSREAFVHMLDDTFDMINTAEKDIRSEYWVTMNSEDTAELDKLFRASRIDLKEDGVYDADILKVMRKVRCKHEPSSAECVEKTE